MKPIKKKTAKFFIALIVVAAVIGGIFTFVPMNFNSFSFASLLGTLNVSSELRPGVYAEYELNEEYSTNQINRSISTIRDVMQDQGHPGANIFSVDNKKIRVEISYSTASSSLKESYNLLKAIGVGVFELRSSSSEEDTYIRGNEHIKGVELQTYNSSTYVVINFNSEGQEAYKDLLAAGSTIYVCMGGETMTSFDSSNASAGSSLPLSFTDYDSAEDFAMRVKLGSMEVGLNPDTVIIDTMSSTLSVGGLTANPAEKGFAFSLTLVLTLVAIAVALVAALIYLIVKYGVIGAFQALALLFDAIIVVAILAAFPWLEISFSSLAAILFGFVIVLTTAQIFCSRVEEEYRQGKTISASLESGFKRCIPGVVAACLTLTLIFGVVAAVATAELRVFGLITCLFSAIAMFNTLIMLPGFINIYEAFNDGATKPYRLTKAKEEQVNG